MKKLLLILLIALTPCTQHHNKDPRIVLVEGPSWSGTAFYIQGASGKTYLITNKHVCQNMSMLLVEEGGGFKVSPVIKIYDKADLCLLTSTSAVKGFKLASDYQIGEKIETIGYPYAHREESRGKVQELQYAPDFNNFYLVLSASSHPGSSGSPVIDPDGKVIGVVALGNANPFIHFAGAVPLAYLKDFLRDM